MDEVLKNCSWCGQKYDKARLPKMLKCGHVRCHICCDKYLERHGHCLCKDCKIVSRKDEIEHYSKYFTAPHEKFFVLGMSAEPEGPSRVKCTECRTIDDETNVQICKTCSFEKILNQPEASSENELSMSMFAICSTCALRKHIKKRHEIVDYFPVLAQEQYEKHLRTVEEKSEAHDKSIRTLKVSVEEMFQGLWKGEDEIEKMTDMIRRSKTSIIQNVLVTKVSDCYNKFNTILFEAKQAIDEKSKEVEDFVGKLAESNKKQNETDCHKDLKEACSFELSSQKKSKLKRKTSYWMKKGRFQKRVQKKQ